MNPFSLPFSADAYRALWRAVFDRETRMEEEEISARNDAPPAEATAPRPTEAEWQSRWFAGEFGRVFTTTDGHPVEIVQFGTWNHSAGPDFTEVAVKVGGRLLTGALELDGDARDWERHGHARNPAYDGVVLHVFFIVPEKETFHTRTSRHRQVAQVRLDPAAVGDGPPPAPAEAKCGRCSFPLAAMPGPRLTSLLEAAARYRLERKARRLARLAELHGWDETLFQELAAAFGYRRNQRPLTMLAQRLPLRLLRTHPAGAEVLLFGAAGFLEAKLYEQAPADTRGYLRELWETWWRHRAEFSAVPPPRWALAGSRPHNHPHRRVGALAVLAGQWKTVRAAFEHDRTAVERALGALAHPFWDRHYTLTSRPAATPQALLGETRVGEILANVAYPYWSQRREPAGWWPDYAGRPAKLDNEKARRAALRLLGRREDARMFQKKLFHQQALLQLYEDFCLQDHSDCAHCLFPELLSKWPETSLRE